MELNYFWVGVANIQRIGLEKRYLHEIPACAMHLPPSSPVFLFFSYFCFFFFVFYWKFIPTVRPTAGPICLLACPI